MKIKTTNIEIDSLGGNKRYIQVSTWKGFNTIKIVELKDTPYGKIESFDVDNVKRYLNQIQRATDKELQKEHDTFLKLYSGMEEEFSLSIKNHFIGVEVNKLQEELLTKSGEKKIVKI